jgi:dihydrofolate reductase
MSSQPATNATAQLSLTEFLSLDGVSQAPGGPAEDTTGDFKHGGWVVPHFSDELAGTMAGIISKAGAFILGRRTYDIFASHWPHITDPNDSIAKALNTLPKFVATRAASQL